MWFVDPFLTLFKALANLLANLRTFSPTKKVNNTWIGFQFDDPQQEPEEDLGFERATLADVCRELDNRVLDSERFTFETTKENVEALLGPFTNRTWINVWAEKHSLRLGIGEEALRRCQRVDFRVNELFHVVRCVQFYHNPSGTLFRKSVVEVRKFTYFVIMEQVNEEADEKLEMDKREMQRLRSHAQMLLQLLLQMRLIYEGPSVKEAMQIQVERDFIRQFRTIARKEAMIELGLYHVLPRLHLRVRHVPEPEPNLDFEVDLNALLDMTFEVMMYSYLARSGNEPNHSMNLTGWFD